MLVLALRVHEAEAGRCVHHLERAHSAPAVVDGEPFRRAPDAVPRELEGACDVGGKLRIVQQEVEDIDAAPERLAADAGGHGGVLGDVLQADAGGLRYLRRQAGRRGPGRATGGKDEHGTYENHAEHATQLPHRT
jgi:hypothetical protein